MQFQSGSDKEQCQSWEMGTRISGDAEKLIELETFQVPHLIHPFWMNAHRTKWKNWKIQPVAAINTTLLIIPREWEGEP